MEIERHDDAWRSVTITVGEHEIRVYGRRGGKVEVRERVTEEFLEQVEKMK